MACRCMPVVHGPCPTAALPTRCPAPPSPCSTSARPMLAPGGVMVMVVQPGERNAYDQQWLQTRLWERHGVRTLRRTLAQVGQMVGWP